MTREEEFLRNCRWGIRAQTDVLRVEHTWSVSWTNQPEAGQSREKVTRVMQKQLGPEVEGLVGQCKDPGS